MQHPGQDTLERPTEVTGRWESVSIWTARIWTINQSATGGALDERLHRLRPEADRQGVHCASAVSTKRSREDIVAELGYTLDLFATDGSRSSDAAMRSGAEQIDVKVDGVTRYSFRQECTHPDGSCELKPSLQPEARWSVPERFFEPGTHQIEIVATDGLGHRSPAGSRVFTINVRSDEDDSDVTLQPGPPAADGSYDLQITATDGQPIGGPKGSVGTGAVSTPKQFMADSLNRIRELNRTSPLGSS